MGYELSAMSCECSLITPTFAEACASAKASAARGWLAKPAFAKASVGKADFELPTLNFQL